MPCYNPQTAWFSKVKNENGNRFLVFKRKDGLTNTEMKIPCNSCIGCRLTRSKEWAVRCEHEAQTQDVSCVASLTYAEENLPLNDNGIPTLNRQDMTIFIKKLRKRLDKKGIRIKYLQCGEYGEEFARPHHHICIFGYDFPDKEFAFTTEKGSSQYISKELSSVWKHGICTVGDFNFDSAQYCASYIVKRVYGKKAENYYDGREPEYGTMSNGIGKEWYEEYHSDLYNHDECVTMSGHHAKMPRYYDKLKERSEKTIERKINEHIIGSELKEIDYIKRSRSQNNVEPRNDEYNLYHRKKTVEHRTDKKRIFKEFKDANPDFFDL